MALVPPPNNSGIPLPPVPANPADLSDITNAHDYIERLRSSRSSGHSHAATNDDVGAAEVFKTAVLFSHTPGPNAAPLWAAQLIATVDQIAANVAQLAPVIAPIPALVAGVAHIPVLVNSVDRLTERIQVLEQRVDELPIIFSNATAGPQGHAIQSITWMGSSIAGSLSQEQRRVNDVYSPEMCKCGGTSWPSTDGSRNTGARAQAADRCQIRCINKLS